MSDFFKEKGENGVNSTTEENNIENGVKDEKKPEDAIDNIKIEEMKEDNNAESNKKKIEELESQLFTYKDQLLRRAAEFENYKRRTENEFINMSKYANEYLITNLLPVIDDFERSFQAGKEKPEFESFYKGIELIYSKFMKVLDQKGLKTIDALNKPFDVNYHEAMMVMQKDGIPPSVVIQELEKGYLLNDKVIRHTKVIVSGEASISQPVEEVKE